MDEKVNALLRKYQDGTCTQEEKELVEAYFNAHVLGNDRLPHPKRQAQAEDRMRHAIDAAIIHDRQPIRSFPYQTVIAAALLLAVAASLILYFRQDNQPKSSLTQHANEIHPGGNRATISFSNGEFYNLSETKEGIVAAADHYTYNDGEEVTAPSENIAYATLTTPRGGQYQITLPDGTKAWLNAASSLKYPAKFDGEERRVILSGEGYFEVTARTNQPFVVESAAQTVNVIGTTFNINAYPDENYVTTTLISGSIRLQPSAKSNSIVLESGLQTTLVDGEVTTRSVVASDYILWKDGVITLHYMTLPEIFKQLERWYDVSFVTNASLPEEDLYGELQRKANLSEVLDVLELNTGLIFKIEGRRVMVTTQ